MQLSALEQAVPSAPHDDKLTSPGPVMVAPWVPPAAQTTSIYIRDVR